MKCDTHGPGCLLNNTVNYARPTEDMTSKTLGMDDDKILDDDREVVDEGHDNQYDDQWFGDMFEVPTDDKTWQAPNRLSAKNMMTALREDCYNQTISPDWTMMQEASQGQQDQDDLNTGGGGHN